MKKKLFVVAVLMLITTSVFAQARGLEVCSESLSYKDVYGRQTTRELKGICRKGVSGHNKWVVNPQFINLSYAKAERLFYGWKFNDDAPGDEFRAAMEKFGSTSSVVFNADGSKRFEIAGKIVSFNNGYGQLIVGEEPTVLGMTSQDIDRSTLKKALAQAALGLDFTVAALSDFVYDAFLLDKKIYRTIADNYERSQKLGFIDVNGTITIEPKFIRSFSHEGFNPTYAIVRTADGFGLINKKSDFVLEPKYYRMQYVSLGQDAARWARKEIVGRTTLFTEDKDCGWLKCTVQHQWLDPQTLKLVYADEGEIYKNRILSTLSGDAKRFDGAGMARLSFAAWFVGGIFFWPFCIYYQKKRKGVSTGKALAKGLTWGMIISASVMAASVLALIFIVLGAFGANMLGLAMSQKD